jgi:hypothetical protein
VGAGQQEYTAETRHGVGHLGLLAVGGSPGGLTPVRSGHHRQVDLEVALGVPASCASVPKVTPMCIEGFASVATDVPG